MQLRIVVPFPLEQAGASIYADRLRDAMTDIGISTTVDHVYELPLPASSTATGCRHARVEYWLGLYERDKQIVEQIEYFRQATGRNQEVWVLWERPAHADPIPDDLAFREVQRTVSGFVVFNAAQHHALASRGVEAHRIVRLSTMAPLDMSSHGLTSNRSELRRQFGWGRQFVGLYVGRFTRWKGIDRFARCWCSHLNGDPMHRLVLLGSGFEQPWSTEESLRRLADTSCQIEIHDFDSSTDRFRFYSAADYLVLPGVIDSEPSVLVEALAHALPILAQDIAAYRELVINGVTGFLSSTCSDAILAVQRLASSPSLRASLGCNARNIAQKERGPRVVAQRHVAAFRLQPP